MEQLKCTECIDEPLVEAEILGRALGAVLVCASCDLLFIRRENSNDWLGDRSPIRVLIDEQTPKVS